MSTRNEARAEIISRLGMALEVKGFRVGPVPRVPSPQKFAALRARMAERKSVEIIEKYARVPAKNTNMLMILGNSQRHEKRFETLAALADARVVPNIRAQGGVLSRASQILDKLFNREHDLRAITNEMTAQGLRNVRDSESDQPAPSFAQTLAAQDAAHRQTAAERGLVYQVNPDRDARIAALTESDLEQLLFESDPDLGRSANQNFLLMATPPGVHELTHDAFESRDHQRCLDLLVEAGFAGTFSVPGPQRSLMKRMIDSVMTVQPDPKQYRLNLITSARDVVRTRLEDLIVTRGIEIMPEARVEMAPHRRDAEDDAALEARL